MVTLPPRELSPAVAHARGVLIAFPSLWRPFSRGFANEQFWARTKAGLMWNRLDFACRNSRNTRGVPLSDRVSVRLSSRRVSHYRPLPHSMTVIADLLSRAINNRNTERNAAKFAYVPMAILLELLRSLT